MPMNEDLKTIAKDVIDLLCSVQDNSPDNICELPKKSTLNRNSVIVR